MFGIIKKKFMKIIQKWNWEGKSHWILEKWNRMKMFWNRSAIYSMKLRQMYRQSVCELWKFDNFYRFAVTKFNIFFLFKFRMCWKSTFVPVCECQCVSEMNKIEHNAKSATRLNSNHSITSNDEIVRSKRIFQKRLSLLRILSSKKARATCTFRYCHIFY